MDNDVTAMVRAAHAGDLDVLPSLIDALLDANDFRAAGLNRAVGRFFVELEDALLSRDFRAAHHSPEHADQRHREDVEVAGTRLSTRVAELFWPEVNSGGALGAIQRAKWIIAEAQLPAEEAAPKVEYATDDDLPF